MMGIKKQLKPILLPLLAVLTAITVTMIAPILAKYADSGTIEGDATLEYFDVDVETTGGATDSNGIVTLDLSDYSNFSLTLNYDGDGKAFVRVLIETSWIEVAGSIQTVLTASTSNALAYTYGTTFKDIGDGYLYMGPLSGTQTIPFISGITGANAPSGATHVKLSIKVEAVQYNRTDAFWGLTAAAIS